MRVEVERPYATEKTATETSCDGCSRHYDEVDGNIIHIALDPVVHFEKPSEDGESSSVTESRTIEYGEGIPNGFSESDTASLASIEDKYLCAECLEIEFGIGAELWKENAGRSPV